MALTEVEERFLCGHPFVCEAVCIVCIQCRVWFPGSRTDWTLAWGGNVEGASCGCRLPLSTPHPQYLPEVWFCLRELGPTPVPPWMFTPPTVPLFTISLAALTLCCPPLPTSLCVTTSRYPRHYCQPGLAPTTLHCGWPLLCSYKLFFSISHTAPSWPWLLPAEVATSCPVFFPAPSFP